MRRFWLGFFAGGVTLALALFARLLVINMIETQRLVDEISAWGEGFRRATRAKGDA